MTGFDLRGAVHEVMKATDLTSPEEIAAKVAENVPPRDLRRILAIVLRDYVRLEIGRRRLAVTPAPKPNRSAKVAAIRDAAPRWLRDRVFVGDAQWRLLGDCSYENLRFLENERLQNAARSVEAARRYGRLAELVEQHGVARVADLPRHVLNARHILSTEVIEVTTP